MSKQRQLKTAAELIRKIKPSHKTRRPRTNWEKALLLIRGQYGDEPSRSVDLYALLNHLPAFRLHQPVAYVCQGIVAGKIVHGVCVSDSNFSGHQPDI